MGNIQIDYHLIVLLGASSCFPIVLGYWVVSAETISYPRGLHEQEQQGKTTRVWEQQFGYFNYESVSDRSWVWALLFWERQKTH